LDLKLINKRQVENILVDTTAQEKNVSYPTDAKLYFKLIEKLRNLSELYGVPIKQSYRFIAKSKLFEANLRKRKKKKAKKALGKLKTYLGRLWRDVIRKLADYNYDQYVIMSFDPLFKLIERIMVQGKNTSNKLYSLHEPEVACIAKGKSNKKYEFGNKVSYAVTSKTSFIVGFASFIGNPHDGKTLSQTIDSVERITSKSPKRIFVDNGYPGNNYNGSGKVFMHKQQRNKNVPDKKYFKRRSRIEPVIVHMKVDSRLGRNYLSGIGGDAFNAILSAVAFNFRKILNFLSG
jgi:IS5 family transposase